MTFEHCYLAEKLLKDRKYQPNHRPLFNKLKQDKFELAKKNFIKGFCHPSPFVQKICRKNALESGMNEFDLSLMIHQNIDYILKSSHWLYLDCLNQFNKDSNLNIIKSMQSRLLEVSISLLNSGNHPIVPKIMLHKAFLSMFLSIFEKKSENPEFKHFYSQSKSIQPIEELTIRISIDKLNIPRNELALLEKLGNSSKLISVLEDLIQFCPGIDISQSVKILILLGCSISRVHLSIAGRFEALQSAFEKEQILRLLKTLGFVTQHTIDIPLICLFSESHLKTMAKDILKMLNIEKLKKYAIGVLMKDDSTSYKLLLALRALKFIQKSELDEDVVYLLVQFIDHYCLELRSEAISSLYHLLKYCRPIENPQIRKILAASPHVLRDRLKLLKYDLNLRISSLKCLVIMWACLDKGKQDSFVSNMHHILVKEQIYTSFIVGSLAVVVNVLKEFFCRSQQEKEAVWLCLIKISPIFEVMDKNDRRFFVNEMKNGLVKGENNEIKLIVKLLIVNQMENEEKPIFLALVLQAKLENKEILFESIANLLYK